MSILLSVFLRSRCQHGPALSYPLHALHHDFLESVPQNSRHEWSRSRLVSELTRGGYKIGERERIAQVAGLASKSAALIERNGKLVMEPARG